ncbi:trypsin 3A1-like [Condylostylus longicornis]|uniref:trypsin 3A1-like n=1 Tax=Condylostylus longicornis TaxID=2530218 RepID=UPI00244DFA8E|nr:trypsin 3A1-like [Condylostylus longicornis]
MLIQLVSIILIPAISAKHAINSFKGRIIGGYDANIADYPYQVSIANPGFGHFCGGSIYKANTIITAAHCVDGIPPSEIIIRAGSSSRKGGGITINVEKIIVSNLWNEKTIDGDIALLILQKNLPISNNIKPIELATDNLKNGDIAYISGWGVTDDENVTEEIDPELPDNLQAVDVPIFDWKECNILLEGKLTKNMFCAGQIDGSKDSCRMDSGGPLVMNNKLYGIISWGRSCGKPNSPGVYTNVKNFIGWIKEISKEN